MAKLKQVLLCSFGLTKSFQRISADRCRLCNKKCHNRRFSTVGHTLPTCFAPFWRANSFINIPASSSFISPSQLMEISAR